MDISAIIGARREGASFTEIARVANRPEKEIRTIIVSHKSLPLAIPAAELPTPVISMNNNEPKELDAVMEINRLHQSFCDGLRTTLQIAIQIGELLVAQKAKCGHGKWIPWIEANLKFNRKTAARYMQCYDRREKLNVSSTRHLTIEEFAKITAEPSEEERTAERPENPAKLEKPTTHQGKVTPEKRKAMLKARADGSSLSEIARDFKLAKSTVHGIVKNVSPTVSNAEATRGLLLKAFKAFYKKHAGTTIMSDRMPALIKDFHQMCSLGTLEEVEAAWLEFKPTVCSPTFTIRI